MRILVVDDEKAIRESLQRSLAALGYDVKTASDGEQALETLEAGDFDILLTDLRMPGMVDGTELCRRVRQARPQMQVVVMTAFPSLETAVATVGGGALDYLLKPVDAAAVQELLGRLSSH